MNAQQDHADSKQTRTRSAAAYELLDELREPDLFDVLETVIDEFLRSRDDRPIRETLDISEEFLLALRDAECLDVFVLLPRRDQARFLRWIGSTAPLALRTKRIETFVSALKASPLDMGRDA